MILKKEMIIAEPKSSSHAASLIQLEGDNLLASWFMGRKEGDISVDIWGAQRIGGVWSEPFVIASNPEFPCWNPVPFRRKEGITMFYKIGRHPSNWDTWMVHTKDDGRSWTEPQPFLQDRGPVKLKPLHLTNGWVLFGGSREGWERFAPYESSIVNFPRWQAFVDLSKDQKSESIQLNAILNRIPMDGWDQQVSGPGVIQPALWESEGGNVHCLLRSTTGRILRSDSTDYGERWSMPQELEMPNNNSGLDVVQLSDGTLCLICNPVESQLISGPSKLLSIFILTKVSVSSFLKYSALI
ncbi:MAG TPA: hypothetical protein ENI23_16255, partial [bacterium]|nr:hypothetical protein [bacterium]